MTPAPCPPTAIRKPQLDDREYRAHTVPGNSLPTLLIHDPRCDKASAALDVGVGYFCDPQLVPGLAHFLEHLLFLGTEKYPDENDYSAFLSKHGGHSNAYTSATNTNYYFDVGPEHLEGALDRFAQFFIAPLFKRDGVDRERNAVDSEFSKNLQQDTWRLHQMLKSLADPAHPFARFGSGNMVTLRDEPERLGINVLDELFAFHRRYYSANLMRLVVLGREPLDQLQAWVDEKFAAVVNKDTPAPSFVGHPLDGERLQKVVFVKPIKETRRVKLFFALPPTHQHWRSKPAGYLSHLVGHESDGSILSLLKRKGWATSLMSSCLNMSKDFDMFTVTVDLTRDGLPHHREVIEIIFQYMNILRKVGAQEWIFRECQKLAGIAFQFKEKSAPSGYTSRTASNMQDYPVEYCLSGPYIHETYDPALIESHIKLITPANFGYMVIAPEFPEGENGPADTIFEKEQWYGTEFRKESLSAEFRQKLENCGVHAELHLPHRNEFIPDKFDVHGDPKAETPAPPKLLIDDALVRVFHKQDDSFGVPKANAYFLLKSPYAYLTPHHAVLTKLFVDLVEDSLSEYSYMADVAGLGYQIDIVQEGMLLAFSGYTDKLPVLMEKVLARVRYLTVDPVRLAMQAERLSKRYANFSKEAPHQHASFCGTMFLQQTLWTPEEKLAALEKGSIQPDAIYEFVNEFFRHLHVEGLVHGNMSGTSARTLVKQVRQFLLEPLNDGESALAAVPASLKRFSTMALPDSLRVASSRTHILPPAHEFTYVRSVPDEKNPNSAIEYYLQVEAHNNLQRRCQLILLVHMMQEPAFDQLRTKEQLGYIVWTTQRLSNGVFGLRMIIQSGRAPEYLEQRIETFLVKYSDTLRDMDIEEFAKHVQSVVTVLKQRPQNLGQESSRWWRQIHSGYYDFDEVNTTVHALQQLTKPQMIEFFCTHIHPASTDRAKLVIHMRSQMTSVVDDAAAMSSPAAVQPLAQYKVDALRALLESKHGVAVSVDELKAALMGTEWRTVESVVESESMLSASGGADEAVDEPTTIVAAQSTSELDAIASKIAERLSFVPHIAEGVITHPDDDALIAQTIKRTQGRATTNMRRVRITSEQELRSYKTELLLSAQPRAIDQRVLSLQS